MENKVVSASTNILDNSLRTGACVMLVGIVNIRFMEHFLNGNSWCCLLANMALIFAIDSTKRFHFRHPNHQQIDLCFNGCLPFHF